MIVDAGEEIDDLMKLCRADITTKNPKNITKYLGNFDRVEKRMNEVIEIDELKAFQSPVRGDEITTRVFEFDKYYVSTKIDGHLCFIYKENKGKFKNISWANIITVGSNSLIKGINFR